MDDIQGRDSDSYFPFHDPDHASPRSRTPWDTVEGRVLSLISRKGGVGKTTSAVNLGGALALSGHTVLIVGLDPQCGVCRSLGVAQDDLETGLGEIFSENIPLTELVQPSSLENLFFVSPRITSLADEESFLADMNRRADDFAREIDRARNLYDTILIDCPPGLGAPTRAALQAADAFLVPVQAEELCRGSLAPLMEFVADFRRRQLPGAGRETPVLEGLFLTMANERTRMGRHVSDQVAEDFGADLLETAVPRTTRLTEMALKGKPAVIYARTTSGSRAYFNLADELVSRFIARSDAFESDDFESDAEEREAAASPSFDAEPSAAEPMRARAAGPAPGALDRFLADLGGTNDINSVRGAAPEAGSPEMVSLDDLLAEEERDSGGRGEHDDDGWAYGIDPDDTLN